MIVGEDAEIAAVFLDAGEREVSLVEANEHAHGPFRTSGVGGFHLERLASGPRFVPPGTFLAASGGESRDREECQDDREKGGESRKFRNVHVG
jgi:hypothetical protein